MAKLIRFVLIANGIRRLRYFIRHFLSLSGTLWFLAACQLLGFFFVKNPQEFWEWSLSMAGYWWFFSFILAILRPNGILVRHFGFAKESAAALQDVTKRIMFPLCYY